MDEKLSRIGNVTDMSEEKLYRDELFTQEDYLKPDGSLDVGAWIIRTTYEIWDMQLPGRINYYYVDDAVIYEDGDENVEGKDAIIKNTLATQAAFPDLEVNILDVIWEGNEEDGYKTSMPSYSTGTNTGYSKYGSPTGKKLTRDNNLSVANCLVEKIDGKWQYTTEWVPHGGRGIELVCTPDSDDKESGENGQSGSSRSSFSTDEST